MADNTNATVPVVATLRAPDGRTFDIQMPVERAYARSQQFWWVDGNGACDCNRSLSIGHQHGGWLGAEPQEDDEHGEMSLPCGDTITLMLLVVEGVTVVQHVDSEAPERG